jgi:hypothetical protein
MYINSKRTPPSHELDPLRRALSAAASAGRKEPDELEAEHGKLPVG